MTKQSRPIDSLILDFFEGDKKVAEMPAKQIANKTRKDWIDFWKIQDSLGRTFQFRRVLKKNVIPAKAGI